MLNTTPTIFGKTIPRINPILNTTPTIFGSLKIRSAQTSQTNERTFGKLLSDLLKIRKGEAPIPAEAAVTSVPTEAPVTDEIAPAKTPFGPFSGTRTTQGEVARFRGKAGSFKQFRTR